LKLRVNRIKRENVELVKDKKWLMAKNEDKIKKIN